jgi:hypothetical protein
MYRGELWLKLMPLTSNKFTPEGWKCVVVWAEEEFEEFYEKKVEEVNGKKRCN